MTMTSSSNKNEKIKKRKYESRFTFLWEILSRQYNGERRQQQHTGWMCPKRVRRNQEAIPAVDHGYDYRNVLHVQFTSIYRLNTNKMKKIFFRFLFVAKILFSFHTVRPFFPGKLSVAFIVVLLVGCTHTAHGIPFLVADKVCFT